MHILCYSNPSLKGVTSTAGHYNVSVIFLCTFKLNEQIKIVKPHWLHCSWRWLLMRWQYVIWMVWLVLRYLEFTYSMYRHKALCETTREVHLILTRLAGIDCRIWELCEEILAGSSWILGGTMEPSWNGAGPAHTYERPCCPAVQACVHVGLWMRRLCI